MIRGLVFTDDGDTIHRADCTLTIGEHTDPVPWSGQLAAEDVLTNCRRQIIARCFLCNPIGLLRDRERRAAA